jgi:transcriptional regulator with XRE-family HTH domain
MKFEEKILQIRKEKGLSQEELAEYLGVSRQAVAKWESGASYPEVDKLIAICNLFQISIDSLLRVEERQCSSYRPGNQRALSEPVIAFLCKAKKECFAGEGNRTSSSRPESIDYTYSEGDYTYLDSYFGGEKFIGEEVLYVKGSPVWSMNYCGRNLGEGYSGNFLTEALLRVSMEYPYRGPLVYKNGDYSYHCIVDGEVEWFHGYEEMFLLDRKVYECFFHGGIIK